MMRILPATLPILLIVACAPTKPAAENSVDINAAAIRAQGAVDAYHANGADAVAVTEPDVVAANVQSAPADDATTVANTATVAPLDPPAPGTPGGLAKDPAPISEAPFTPDSAQGAATVVQTYYALIGEGAYRRAFALRDAGATSFADFTADLARYSEYHANVGAPGAIDAGAGQRYVTVPVQIYARLKQGAKPVYEIGSVTLHRTDVDGATAAQRIWHIRTIDLKPAPKR